MSNEESKMSYSGLHTWVRNQIGNAAFCSKDPSHNAKRYEWALKKGFEYEKNIDNFIQLCKSCHVIYDGVNKMISERMFKGGRPKCKNCDKELTNYKNKTSLCGLCNRKLNPPWKGKHRDMSLLNKKRNELRTCKAA